MTDRKQEPTDVVSGNYGSKKAKGHGQEQPTGLRKKATDTDWRRQANLARRNKSSSVPQPVRSDQPISMAVPTPPLQSSSPRTRTRTRAKTNPWVEGRPDREQVAFDSLGDFTGGAFSVTPLAAQLEEHQHAFLCIDAGVGDDGKEGLVADKHREIERLFKLLAASNEGRSDDRARAVGFKAGDAATAAPGVRVVTNWGVIGTSPQECFARLDCKFTRPFKVSFSLLFDLAKRDQRQFLVRWANLLPAHKRDYLALSLATPDAIKELQAESWQLQRVMLGQDYLHTLVLPYIKEVYREL